MKLHRFQSPHAGRARLPPRREALVHVVLGTVWISGVGWLVFHYFLRQASEFGELPHPLETWWLRLHGAAAFATLWLLGMLWVIHLVPGWRARRRSSGIVLAGMLALLSVSGYLLYYAGGDDARAAIALVHWVVGAALPLFLLPHVLRGRQPRSQGNARTTRRR
ncbi:MAG: hypothetical protein ABI082_04275 [Dokdonella sp.]